MNAASLMELVITGKVETGGIGQAFGSKVKVMIRLDNGQNASMGWYRVEK